MEIDSEAWMNINWEPKEEGKSEQRNYIHIVIELRILKICEVAGGIVYSERKEF
jgi:hypothetical protein